jgi:hypothetical protein
VTVFVEKALLLRIELLAGDPLLRHRLPHLLERLWQQFGSGHPTTLSDLVYSGADRYSE